MKNGAKDRNSRKPIDSVDKAWKRKGKEGKQKQNDRRYEKRYATRTLKSVVAVHHSKRKNVVIDVIGRSTFVGKARYTVQG